MLQQLSPWKPKYLAENSILWAELIENGSKFAATRLEKEKKGTFPSTGTPVNCSSWWKESNKGKKKGKRAALIMAVHYYPVIHQLDRKEGEVLQLEAEIKSQGKEITSLQLKLQEVEGEKHQMLQLVSQTKSLKEDLKLLRLKLQEVEDEKHKLLLLEYKTMSQQEETKLLLLQWEDEKRKLLQLENKTKSQEEDLKALRLKQQQWENKKRKLLQLENKTKSQEEEIKSLRLKLQNWEDEKRKLLQLENKTKSQKEEIKALRLKLQHWEDEKRKLLQLENRTKSQEEEIKSLKFVQQKIQEEYELQKRVTDNQLEEIALLRQTVQKQRTESEDTRDKLAIYDISRDDRKNSRQLVPSSAWWKTPPPHLIQELPDLQFDNSNYEFWAKIKSWLLKGEVDPQCVFNLVRVKCPMKAWDKIKENFEDNDDLSKTAIPGPLQALAKLWNDVSKALGPGTNLFQTYYFRRQQDNETFEEYLQEKFRLYCSHGVENMEPDKNDQHFLYNAIEKAATRYQDLVTHLPKSYTDLLNMAMINTTSRAIMPAGYDNKCTNCGWNGHTQAECRTTRTGRRGRSCRCYACGQYGHCYWECWNNYT